MSTEPDLTEAMEVWREAIDAASDSSIKFKTRADQAAARVIATALEARDRATLQAIEIIGNRDAALEARNARIQELEGVIASARERLDQFSTEGGGRKFERDMRTILTKQEPKA